MAFFVGLYLAVSVGVGIYAARRVQTSGDFILAGRSLPLYIVTATVFVTFFGSEAVLGIPATFMEENLGGIVADPIGAGLCLVFVGLFFAVRIYRMKLNTIGDFYRVRFGPAVELMVSIAICISYLGWISAQIVALGLVINIVTMDMVSFELGMVLGLISVMAYTVFGGMVSVAIVAFIQMIAIIIGLLIVADMVAGQVEGGYGAVIAHAAENGKFEFWPSWDVAAILAFFGAFITLALGSIPQQDVFQRVMSAKDETVAARGSVYGGLLYIAFCFIPIFIAYGVLLIDPAIVDAHMAEGGDSQRILPDYILGYVPLTVQVLFFGALLSAIMSTAAGTLIAPSAIFAENILRPRFAMDDRRFLLVLRLSVVAFGLVVLVYGWLSASAGLSIFEMVENAYLVTLCGAFTPLAFGVYWKRATNAGALASIICGVGTWVVLEAVNWQLAGSGGELLVPPQVAGLAAAIIGMVLGSLYLGSGATRPARA